MEKLFIFIGFNVFYNEKGIEVLIMKSNLAKRFLVALSVATMLFSNTVSARSYSGDDSAKEELSNIVVLAKFKDQKSNDFYAKNSDGLRVDQQLLSDYNYLSKYIGDISYGNESIQNIFPHYNSKNKSIGVITLNLTESEAASKLIDEKIINEVVKRLNSSKSFINIDVDKNRDGYVDNLSIVLQGQSKYSTDVPSLWPHYFYVDQNSQVEKLNTITGNLAVKDYNILNTGETKNGGLGIIAHEYLHRLGYPDLYTSDGSTNPVGNWDVMAVNSRKIRYPLAYLRYSISGWMNIPTVKRSESNLRIYPQQYKIDKNKNIRETAYIIESPYNLDEKFVVEMRSNNDMDNVSGEGLIVYRIDTMNQNLSNFRNEESVYVFRNYPGITDYNSYYSLRGAYMDGKERDHIGSLNTYDGMEDGALVYKDGTNSGIAIRNVKKLQDGSMTFDVVIP